MEIEERVRIKNAKSCLWQMVTCGIEGVYEEQYKTKEGKEQLFKAYQEELDHVVNVAFEKGREYEAKRK